MKRTNSDLLFAHRIFKGIANSAIELFIPLIIYNKTHSLTFAFTFSVIKCFCVAFLFLILKRFMRKNAILSVLLSIIPIILAEFLLNIEIELFLIFILAILAALSETLYYGAINIIFAVMDKSANSAKFDIGYNIGQIIFTIFSAYILGNVKNSLIFVVIFASVLHIICIIPLIKNYKQLNSLVKNIPKNNQFEVIKNIKGFNFYHYFFGSALIITEVILPLYLNVKGLSFTAVGIFLAAGQIIKILANIFTKLLQNKNQDIFAVIIFSTLFVISLSTIIFVQNSLVIYIFNLIVTFACQGMHTIVFVKYVKSTVKNGYIYDSIYYRDFFQNTGRATSVTILVLTSIFPIVFGVGIVSSVLSGVCGIFAVKKVNEDEKALLQTENAN